MKSKTTLVLIFTAVFLLISCNPTLEQPYLLEIPSLPKALLGNDSARRSGSRSIAAGVGFYKEKYGEYYVVPQIAINYDYFVSQYEDFLMNVSESESWVDLEDDDIFARQLFETQTVHRSGDSDLSIHLLVKESKDRSMLESHFFMSDPAVGNVILTILQHDKSSHAVMARFPNHDGSPSTDVIEIWQSDKVTLTKCVRTSKGNENKSYFFHFISLTDRTSGDNHTIGMAKREIEIYSLDGAEKEVENFEEYGYFTDSELGSSQANPSSFPDLERFETFIFTQGITGKSVGELIAVPYANSSGVADYNTTQNSEFIANLDWEDELGTLDTILKL